MSYRYFFIIGVGVEAPVEEKWMHIATVPIDRASLTKYKPGTCILR